MPLSRDRNASVPRSTSRSDVSALLRDLPSASFSTISERLTPAELVEFINEYLSEMCDIIEYYGGTIDKFEGDAIVAFFGAPVFYEDHAVRAVMACIDRVVDKLESQVRKAKERLKDHHRGESPKLS